MTSFALIGSGYRAEILRALADGLPSLRCVGAVVRTPRSLSIPTFASLAECVRDAQPDFVITATPSTMTPGLVEEAVAQGIPVLAETPPAPDVESLRSLWSLVGSSGLVQVAEKYLLYPSHAARAAVVRSGAIGTPTQVQVSSTQLYHAVSLIRGFLGAGRGPVRVHAVNLVAPLLDPLNRQGRTHHENAKSATTTLATIDFGDGQSGVYDFTDNQTRNQLRFRRLLVRGSAGELQNDDVVRMVGPQSIVTTPLVRRQTGHDLELNGFETDHISWGSEVVYRNPYLGRRYNDEEIAIRTLLEAMAAWVRGEGPAPYSLADAAQDHLIGLAIQESAKTGQSVTTATEAWA